MSATDFGKWALDPKRTDDEAYFAERVVESGLSTWRSRHRQHESWDWEKFHARQKRRKLNPAHRAKLKNTDVARAVEVLPEMTYLSLDAHSDRPIRDLSGLRFLPQLKNLQLGNSEINDLSPLSTLPDLEELHLSDKLIEDLRPIAMLKTLRRLWVSVWRPWPRVDGLDALHNLEFLYWNGSLLVLEGLGPFPRLREAHLNSWMHNVPVRDATRLPEMPAIEVLIMGDLYRLDGIERYRHALNLTLEGEFRTLEPLTAFTRLTHLSLTNDQPLDLAPLCRLPELRVFNLTGVQPQEFFVLTDAPRLREVNASRCEANDREVATLREVLKPWEEFQQNPPRPLSPLRFVAENRKDTTAATDRLKKWNDYPDPWPGNKGMHDSEWNWIVRQLQAALDQQFGKGWGEASQGWVRIYSIEVADQLEKFLHTARQVFAACRYPHHVMFSIDLLADWHLTGKDWKDPEEAQRERDRAEDEDFEIRQREEALLREREHRLRQLRQEGAKINPEEFEAPPDPPKIETADPDSNVLESDEEEEHPRADEYRLYADINEEGLFVNVQSIETAERLLNRQAERE